MPTTNWSLFAAALAVAVAFLLVAARASERLLLVSETDTTGPPTQDTEKTAPAPGPEEPSGAEPRGESPPREPDDRPRMPERGGPADVPIGTPAARMSTESLLLNAAVSQALLGGVVGAAVWFAGVPPTTLGLDGRPGAALVTGVGLGLGLAAANEVSAGVAERLGVDYDERLRHLLAPDSPRGWALLLGVVLPLVAVVEELLFRGAMIGGLSAGFALPPAGLAVGSSLLFGLGHGAQGRGGVAVTAGLGLVLAGAFVVTGSLYVVIVAHYLVNALEFVLHEGLGVDPF